MRKDAVTRDDRVSLTNEEETTKVLTSAVFGLWDVVNNLTRLQPSKRERYRVSIFGSARARPGTFGYEDTKRLATALADLGLDLPRCVANADEAIAIIRERHKEWQKRK